MTRSYGAVASLFVSLLLATVVGAQEADPERPTLAPEEEPEGAELPTIPPWSYTFTDADRLLAAQAVTHESTWASGSRTNDASGILQVLMERRRDGESFRSVVRRTMPRFYAGTTSRAWVRGLTASPLRHNPIGWPASWPAAAHYSDSWRAVYRRVQHVIDGVEPLACSPAPRQWFGRVVDHEAMARMIDRGWRESDCGEASPGERHATVNAFLYEIDPE